jgi:hypothetical protein
MPAHCMPAHDCACRCLGRTSEQQPPLAHRLLRPFRADQSAGMVPTSRSLKGRVIVSGSVDMVAFD